MGVSEHPCGFPRGRSAAGSTPLREMRLGARAPQPLPLLRTPALPTRLFLGGARVPGPQAVPTTRCAVSPGASRKLRDFPTCSGGCADLALCGCKARSRLCWGAGPKRAWALRARAVGEPRRAQGGEHLGARAARDGACPWGFGFGQLRSAGGCARGFFAPRCLSRAGAPRRRGGKQAAWALPHTPLNDLEPCCSGWALRASLLAPAVLEPSGWLNGKRGPTFLASLCGAKATSLPLSGAAVGREVSLWLASRAEELSTTRLSNGEAPRAVCALPPRGPSAAEFLGRWEAADHYGCFLRMCKEAFTGLQREGRPRGKFSLSEQGRAAVWQPAMKGSDTPSLLAGAWKWLCRHPQPTPFPLPGLTVPAQEPPHEAFFGGPSWSHPPGLEQQAHASSARK